MRSLLFFARNVSPKITHHNPIRGFSNELNRFARRRNEIRSNRPNSRVMNNGNLGCQIGVAVATTGLILALCSSTHAENDQTNNDSHRVSLTLSTTNGEPIKFVKHVNGGEIAVFFDIPIETYINLSNANPPISELSFAYLTPVIGFPSCKKESYSAPTVILVYRFSKPASIEEAHKNLLSYLMIATFIAKIRLDIQKTMADLINKKAPSKFEADLRKMLNYYQDLSKEQKIEKLDTLLQKFHIAVSRLHHAAHLQESILNKAQHSSVHCDELINLTPEKTNSLLKEIGSYLNLNEESQQLILCQTQERNESKLPSCTRRSYTAR